MEQLLTVDQKAEAIKKDKVVAGMRKWKRQAQNVGFASLLWLLVINAPWSMLFMIVMWQAQ